MPDSTNDELRNAVHMKMLAKSGSSKDFNELTVIPLGFAVSIAMQLIHQHTEQAVRDAENYGRLSSLADLLTWFKLHDIEDVSMVADYVDHCTKSITQLPDQRYVSQSRSRRRRSTSLGSRLACL